MHAHSHTHPPAPPRVVLDGVEILPAEIAAEIAAEMQHPPRETAKAAWHDAAEALVLRRLLLAEDAERALPEVKADPSRLPVLAAAFSGCPSRTQGGDLGVDAPGTTVPAFLAREDGPPQPFEAVQPRIAAWLQESAWRRAAHQFMAILAARAEVDGLVLSAGADGPLVQ